MENNTKTIIYVAAGLAGLGILYLVFAPKPAVAAVPPVAAKPATASSSTSLVKTATGLFSSIFGGSSSSSDSTANSTVPALADTSNSLADVTTSTTVSNASPAAAIGNDLLNTAPTISINNN